ncbi:MAG: chromosome segregation protein SMC [Alphaproteobacteria bacterium]|nr:chromosome segregation protein SMC [Alphaproteobacteria bacterium]MBV8547871.1 chromosome segregation protein SMC [Alphaproteobacteria bacterium]
MHFTRLRLHGFKSFVEQTDLDIGPGMTGIVGPNGCGKSNLVEALRWVMGETSAKRMRGADMDDVIFAGTTTRPSRSVAEVALMLDNADHSATAEYNNDESLQVTRRIERDCGSEYLINSKPVRMRDVQLLFADQATGAHSTSLVGQGQIDALIRAKPQDRRQILEEASGTAGLHARRHEAELKLKGAEQNLTRVDDVLKAYDTQLRSLKTQVRQASRYRNLAEHIRRTEAALLLLRWQEAEHNAAATREALQQAEQRVNELLAIVTQGTTRRTEIAAELPQLRQDEATAAAIVQKLTLLRQQIETERARLDDEIRATEQLLRQTESDRGREQARLADGEAATQRLQAEQEQLTQTRNEVAAQLPEATQALVAVSEQVENLDIELTALTEAVMQSEARRQSLQKQLSSVEAQRAQMAHRREQLETQRAELAAEAATRPDLALIASLVEASETELTKKQQQAQQAEQNAQDAIAAEQQARDVTRDAQAKVTKLKAEADALTSLLQHGDEQHKQVIDQISVTPGLEDALAVALGEALTAALDETAARYWRDLPPLATTTTLPTGVTPISQYIQAPPALARSLSQIGLVETVDAGQQAAQYLQPGQIIVSRDGWAWRWDGFTVTPQAKTTTAVRLQQRNRLSAVQQELQTAETTFQGAEAVQAEAAKLAQTRREEDQQARNALRAAFAALNDARSSYAQQERETTAITSKIAALDETLSQLAGDIEGVAISAQNLQNEYDTLPDVETQRVTLNEKRTQISELRNQQAQKNSDYDRLQREEQMLSARATAIVEEIAAWQSRLGNATEQLQALAARIAETEAQLETLRARPVELETRHAALLTELSEAETKRKAAADILISTEQKLATVEQQLRADEAASTEARESRVRAEGAVTAADEQFHVLRERMQEKLECEPEALASIADLQPDEAQDASHFEQTLARYVRERDGMGPVNLRAETEADTMQGEIDKLTAEKDDLTAAIAKLRQGIGQLNREARERLQSSFTLVNERFQKLFGRLFGGGKAHLELIDNEDPLNAGLEIFAAPPGKKQQILSLLSGGERTLTALALLFAVFQTNPSPICVLDEAEAALDESNIDRFCGLVEDIARETGTRFLIITHQRLTMARMDRLYGVTMAERGVSQLVSVDLAGAVAIRDGEEFTVLEQQDLPLNNPAADKAAEALSDVQAA